MGWIGVDFDGTIAEKVEDYADWKVGAPIPEMVDRVNQAIDKGREVKIFTARTGSESKEAINNFCLENFGRTLPITNVKDKYMEELWDDRAINPHMKDADMPEMQGMGNLAAAMREHVKGKFKKKKDRLHRPYEDDKKYSPARRKRMKHYAR